MNRITRRELLGTGIATGIAGVAGCLGGGDGTSGGSNGDSTTGGNDGSTTTSTTEGGEMTTTSTTEGGGSTPTGSDGTETDGTGSLPTWRTAELTDVRSGETFTVEGLPKPVFLETFAVWCSVCLRQQRAVSAFHEQYGDAATSVALNIDPNEDAARVRDHAENHGFDWQYAVSPPPVTNSLVDQFGNSMTVPPRAPMVLVCESGARRLADGVKSADDLRAAIDRGC